MSKISLTPNASGTGNFTIASPNSNTDRTLTLPDSTGTVVVTSGAQTIEFADGSASAPSITNSGDTNTGMFFPAADTIAFAEGGTEQMRLTDTGLLQFNSGYGSVATAYGCRAWVKFDGTGTVAINGSGNVSSITDNGTGDYTVNFTTAMPDANYSVANTSTGAANDEQRVKILATSASSSPTTYTTSAVRLAGYTSTDYKVVTVSIFR